MNGGFIILYRSLLEWEWYNDPNTLRVFLHCLLRANHKDKKWQGINIPRGSFVTSYQSLALELGMTVQNVRTAINKLKSTGELTHKSHTKYGVITINNYTKFQDANSQTNSLLTFNQQSTNNKQQINKETNKQDNNIKAEKSAPVSKKKFGEIVTMTEEQYDKLVDTYGQVTADRFIDKVDLYCGSKGKKYKDYYLTIINWIKRDEEKNGPKITYSWQEELKKEQEENDSKTHQPKRSLDEVKNAFEKL